jgi:hypothetical protein
MANPGYGKRSAPRKSPYRKGDFAHLPAREASIAALIDRLPDGAAIDAKTLAKEHPDYGQAACRTALNRLSEAGHLRRVKEHVIGEDSARWVYRTYFSRTARDDVWWAAFLAGHVPEPQERAPEPKPAPVRPASRSRAYDVLARLGRTDPRTTLSAAECAALEDLAAQWLAHGATESQLLLALTTDLPSEVRHPGGFARARLIARMPPESGPSLFRVMECTVCRAPGRPEALPGGICHTCRGEPHPRQRDGLQAAEVHTRVERLRAAARTHERSRT